jgi:hypothetical protein
VLPNNRSLGFGVFISIVLKTSVADRIIACLLTNLALINLFLKIKGGLQGDHIGPESQIPTST